MGFAMPARPFIKFVGGKTQLLPVLLAHCPEKFNVYYEPFLGGGALFFELARLGRLTKGNVYLNDLNEELINVYAIIDSAPHILSSLLDSYAKDYAARGEKFYYEARAVNIPKDKSIQRAARFIFLNKTCYNGLYRVNKSGGFNVPAGTFKTPPTICDRENILGVSKLALDLDVGWTRIDFEAAVKRAKRGDFVYFDPPYWPASATSDFTAYNKEPFGPAEQERLRDVALRLKRIGVKVLLSNADVAPIRKLYSRKEFELIRVEARRSVNSKGGKRGAVGELLIW
jgi:DNA adenine methylase